MAKLKPRKESAWMSAKGIIRRTNVRREAYEVADKYMVNTPDYAILMDGKGARMVFRHLPEEKLNLFREDER